MNQTKRPSCSVCIANYNGERFLRNCIDSVLAQETSLDVEIIVHDDASTDASVDLLRTHYPQVRLIESRENVGFCVSNNRMARAAQGDFILLLNNDAALFPDALETLWKIATREAKDCILTLPQYQWDTGELVDRGCLLDPFYNPIPNDDPGKTNVAMVMGACLWISRSLWDELGGFPEWMGSIGEDLYLCCLARTLGHGVYVSPRSGYRHHVGSSFGGAKVTKSGLRTSFRRRALSERNKTYALIVFTQGMMLPLMLAVHLTALLFEGAVLATLRLDPRIFTTIYVNVPRQVVKHWSTLMRVRISVAKRRRATARTYYSAFRILPRKILMLCKYGIPKIQ